MPSTIPLPYRHDAKTPDGVEVSQGFGGGFTHDEEYTGGIFYYSVDFLLSPGSPVLAQGSGTVKDLVETVPDGGPASTGNMDPSLGTSKIGNFVTVAYDDGFYATYQHLAKEGVNVSEGQRVNADTVLGFVGNTGYRTDTHLHVTYGLETNQWMAGLITDGSQDANNNTAPVRFDTPEDEDGILNAYRYYHGRGYHVEDLKDAKGEDLDDGEQQDTAPVITGYDTFQEGDLIFLRLNYTDPDGDAEGFGFRGVNGSGWAEETHPFSDPSYGRVSEGTIAYPFNHLAASDSPIESDVEAWIYDKEGWRSDPVTVHLQAERQEQREVSETTDPIPTDEVPFFILGGSNSELDPIGGTAM